MEERVEDLLTFYALGALTDEEQQVEAYLAAHPQVRAELLETKDVVSELAYSAPPVPPPAQLKNNLMQRIRADVPAQTYVAAPAPSLMDTFKQLWGRASYRPAMPFLAALSLLVAVVAGLWVFQLQREVAAMRTTLAALNRDLTQKIAPLQAQVDPLAEENESLKQDVSNQQQNIVGLDNRLVALQKENAALKADIATQSKQLASLNNKMSQIAIDGAVLAEITMLKQQVANQNDLLTALQDETISSLAAEVEQLQAANDALNRELSSQRAAMAQLTTPNARVMLIEGTATLPNAHGHLMANPNENSALLVVAGLPELQPGLEYYFWLVQDGAPRRVGALDVDREGLGLLIVAADQQIGAYEGMGVSIEPSASSGDPTNEMIMLGQLS